MHVACSHQELQETLKEAKQKHDRQTKMLSETNAGLQCDVERLSVELEKAKQQSRTFEDRVNELKERKEQIQQWEGQVAEIIQW